MSKIAIVLEGGLVQAVVSDDPAFIGAEFVVIDYDTEGADEDEITPVEQGDGTFVDACLWHEGIRKSGITIP